ncbi:MAG: hypothetical protein KKF98_13460 [Bacteroidetes bacterium]|nr:hypothetical protein [Bacteroidota bacterium]
MKPEYLGQQWSEITRDERHFCFDLILQLKLNNTEANFISWLIEAAKLELDESFDGHEYEIDIEVCYYRDLIFRHEYQNGKRFADKKLIKGFLKRTFDFCIFLPKDIIIIEAKAAKGMTSSQLGEFKKDKEAIKICHKYLGLPLPKVHTIALVSKEYFEKSSWLKEQDKMNGYFDNIIYWEQIQNDSGSNYHMPATLANIYSLTSKMATFNTANNRLMEELKNISASRE